MVKSKSISTDRRGRSKIVKLIAVPPFKAKLLNKGLTDTLVTY